MPQAQVRVIEAGQSAFPSGINFQDVPLLHRNGFSGQPDQSQLHQCPVQDLLGGGVEIGPQGGEMQQGQRVVPFDQVQAALLVKHCDGERAVQRLRHGPQAPCIQPPLALQKLNGYIAVRLNDGGGQPMGLPEQGVVEQYSVVGQSERVFPRPS